MRVLFVDGEELVLKEVISIQVGRGQILLEADSGDKRAHIIPHSSWTNDDLVVRLRAQAHQAVVDLEAIAYPKEGSYPT